MQKLYQNKKINNNNKKKKHFNTHKKPINYTDNGAKYQNPINFTKLTSKRKKVKHFKTPFDFC